MTWLANVPKTFAQGQIDRRLQKERKLIAERLRAVLHYAPSTGVFTWLCQRSGVPHSGMIAGANGSEGYRLISVDGVRYKAHRLAWLYMTGEWPSDQIDHVNGVPGDDRFINLREATPGQNQMNSRSWADSGAKGVTWGKRQKRWKAQGCWGGKTHHLGYFKTIEEASAAYCKAAAEYQPEFWRGK